MNWMDYLMAGKVLIIGLDGATWELIAPWCSEGELPTLSKLMKYGACATLNSTIVPISPVAWTSFATGTNPDKHGIYDFLHRKHGSYESEPYNSRSRKSETMWGILSKQNKKVGVLNVPSTYPVDKVNGFMVAGYPTPEDLGDFTYPRDLLRELKKELGNDFRFQPKISNQNKKPFLEEMHTATDFVYKATEYLMNNYDWELLITVFTGTDSIGHTFWEYMDPAHPNHDPSAPNEFKNAILNIYKKLDKIIAALMKNIDDDTTLMINSDHGFGALNYGVSINNWLLQQGFIKIKNDFGTRLRYWWFKRGLNYYNLFKLIKSLKVEKKVARAQKKRSKWVKIANKFFLTKNDIDWARTRAYSMGNLGQLYINLKGREPQGIVEPKGEYTKVINEIIKSLKKFKNPLTNKTIFTDIYRKEDAYPNATIEDHSPDIIFFDKKMEYSIYRVFEFGSKDLISRHPIWSGIHRPNGIFIAYNKNYIRAGAKLDNVSICDIAPTALHIIGSPILKDMDGRVLLEIFKKGSRPLKRSISYQDLEKGQIQNKIQELKGLGKI